jgi:hypothetical protein
LCRTVLIGCWEDSCPVDPVFLQRTPPVPGHCGTSVGVRDTSGRWRRGPVESCGAAASRVRC